MRPPSWANLLSWKTWTSGKTGWTRTGSSTAWPVTSPLPEWWRQCAGGLVRKGCRVSSCLPAHLHHRVLEVQGAARSSRSLRGGTCHRPPGDGLQGAGDRRAHTGDRPDHARPDLRGESRYTEGRRRDDPRGQGLPEAAGEKAACAQRACPLAAGSVFLRLA